MVRRRFGGVSERKAASRCPRLTLSSAAAAVRRSILYVLALALIAPASGWGQIPPLGDVNCDLQLDEGDLLALVPVFFGAPNRCGRADVNGDGVVSAADLTAVELLLFGSSATPTASAGVASVTPTTPTPAGSATATRTPLVELTPPTATSSPVIATPSVTPSFTMSATVAEATATPTTTGSPAPSSTSTRTPSVTTTPSFTRTATRTPTPSFTHTPTYTFTLTRSETPTRTPSISPTPSVTRTFTLSRTPTPTATATFTRTVPPTFTPTRTPSLTRTPTQTRTASLTPTRTSTRTPTPTATTTPTLGPGAQITFFGLARADGTVLTPSGFTNGGDPIYVRFGNPDLGGASGFLIVVEARAGASGSPPGNVRLNSNPLDPNARPDLQIQVNRDLGNGSTEICDKGSTDPEGPRPGGVPGINPPSFSAGSQSIADALNDLACRFDYKASSSLACTVSESGNFRFASTLSTDQFCSETPVDVGFRFPIGDTLMTVRWRDNSGVLGPEARLVVRVTVPGT